MNSNAVVVPFFVRPFDFARLSVLVVEIGHEFAASDASQSLDGGCVLGSSPTPADPTVHFLRGGVELSGQLGLCGRGKPFDSA